MKFRLAIVSALALSAALGAGAVQARDADVQWSVTIGSPVYGHRSPVVAVPVYPAYRYQTPVYAPIRYQAPTRWDRDGDRIPDRHDRFYNPSWDRDGDGIPNRHDRAYTPRWDRDGDGVPNRYDRNDRRDHDNRRDHDDDRRDNDRRDNGRGR